MKHYFHPMSRGMTTDWMLTELEAPHEKIIIDFFAGENNTPEYRAIGESVNDRLSKPLSAFENILQGDCPQRTPIILSIWEGDYIG